ncbi:MAG: flotillin [Limisphaerales bacterium]|jgi:flotillin
MEPNSILPIILVVALFLFLGFFLALMKRYKRVPSDKILVVYGMVGKKSDGTGNAAAKVYHGGATFVWPMIQDFSYLDLRPISIDVQLIKALSKQNIRVDVPAQFTVAISRNREITSNAAERLLGVDMDGIHQLAHEIILGQLRLTVATMDIEEINTDRDIFLSKIQDNVETELNKIGLTLINVNIQDISDESGYIEALGEEAAARAINDAKVKTAEQLKIGETGSKGHEQQQRVEVAKAHALAKVGENKAMMDIAKSNADLEIEQTEASKRASVAQSIANAEAKREKEIAEAEAQKAALNAQREAEEARAAMEDARLRAEKVVGAEIAKREAVIAAEALAESEKRRADGKAYEILKLASAEAEGNKKKAEAQAFEILEIAKAEAEGIQAKLVKTAEGLERIVGAAGDDPRAAAMLMMIDKLEKLREIDAEALKNIKIDKTVVWSGGNNGDGGSISGHVKDVLGTLAPYSDLLELADKSIPFLSNKEEKKITPAPAPKKDTDTEADKLPDLNNAEKV